MQQLFGRRQAYQRLAWAGSLSRRLGASSAAYLLPSGAQHQGYIHENVVQHLSTILSKNLRLAASVSVRASGRQTDFMWRRAQMLRRRQSVNSHSRPRWRRDSTVESRRSLRHGDGVDYRRQEPRLDHETSGCDYNGTHIDSRRGAPQHNTWTSTDIATTRDSYRDTGSSEDSGTKKRRRDSKAHRLLPK